MFIFYTPSTKHLQDKIPLESGSVIFKKFSDGELYVKVNEDVAGKDVWVIASTEPPAENILYLVFLLNALQRSHARIHLIMTYFGYARQSVPKDKEADSSDVVASLIHQQSLENYYCVHPHHTFKNIALPYQEIIPINLIALIAQNYDCIASTDYGSQQLARTVALKSKRPLIIIEKNRLHAQQVIATNLLGNVVDKRVLLVDDMLSTGSTAEAAALQLGHHGATSIGMYVTHGIFTGESFSKVLNSGINHLYTTDTLDQSRAKAALGSRMTIQTIASLILSIITQASTVAHRLKIPPNTINTHL